MYFIPEFDFEFDYRKPPYQNINDFLEALDKRMEEGDVYIILLDEVMLSLDGHEDFRKLKLNKKNVYLFIAINPTGAFGGKW